MNFLLTLIIQISVILITSRVIGLLFRKIHQPQVVGEMVAGILLGPSLLGWLAPDVSAFIFPNESLQYLNTLSQIGLLLFMFIIGLELDPGLIKGRGHATFLISHVSIILPFMLGASLSLYLYPRLSDNSVTFTAFALFLGASMSITAFPVLARILSEKNLIKTKVGAVTIACAAIDDVTAWSILAVVVGLVRADASEVPLWLTLSGTALFILVMLFVIRPFLNKLEIFYKHRGNRLTPDIMGIVLLLMFASAWTTEWLGIHALFGAFLMGSLLPRNKRFLESIIEKLNDITVVLLLPIFFALTGLRTSIGLVSGAEMWFYFGIILMVAVFGKLGGSAITAKISGLHLRESLGLGILMNTRGLMELIILTIGLEIGVISPALFAMMVMMALVTTFMTTPFFDWVYPDKIIRKELEEVNKEKPGNRILTPVSFPSSGPGLVRIASFIYKRDLKIYALHLTKVGDISVSHFDEKAGSENAMKVFQPMMNIAAEKSVTISPLAFATRNVADDISHISEIKGINMIIMGWHKPVLNESVFSGTVREVLNSARCDVCVYLERQFNDYKNILVPFNEGVHDKGALQLAHRIAVNTGALLTVLHIVKPRNPNDPPGPTTAYKRIEDFPDEQVRLQVIESNEPLETVLKIAKQNFDLIVVGLSETWGLDSSLLSNRHERLIFECPASVLVLRKYVPAENK